MSFGYYFPASPRRIATENHYSTTSWHPTLMISITHQRVGTETFQCVSDILAQYVLLEYPAEHVLRVVINQEKDANALSTEAHWEMHRVFDWFDEQPELWVAILTGKGEKAFCAGQNLKKWLEQRQAAAEGEIVTLSHPPSGFGGISRRSNGRKPVIAAVNGFAMGGGFEIVLNCDIVVCVRKAKLALPEVKRGVYAAAGGLSRATRILGLQRASELIFTGQPITAEKAMEWGVVNAVVETQAELQAKALDYARMIVENSPDSVRVSKTGIRLAYEIASTERTTQMHNDSEEVRLWAKGYNINEGLKAFKEKRSPKWKSSL